jgi:hypothetical protein
MENVYKSIRLEVLVVIPVDFTIVHKSYIDLLVRSLLLSIWLCVHIAKYTNSSFNLIGHNYSIHIESLDISRYI